MAIKKTLEVGQYRLFTLAERTQHREILIAKLIVPYCNNQ